MEPPPPATRTARTTIGAHTVELEPPDLCTIRLSGDLSFAEVSAMLDVFEGFSAGRDRAYILIDLARVGSIAPEARAEAGQRQLPPAYAGLVLFGGSFHQQVAVKLATMAGWLLRGRRLGKPMPEVARDEREARTWVARQRATARGPG